MALPKDPSTPTPTTAAVPKPATQTVAAKAPAGRAAGVSAADWALVQKVARTYKIDPYILVAIGIHETGWGTLGDGRNGNILGVGSYDSGSTYKYAGLENQLVGAAKILQRNGVHTIADIAAGKLAPTDGKVRYASDPNWSNAVIATYNSVSGTKFTGTVSSAVANGIGGTPQATSQQIKDTVAAQYGYLSGFLDNPEIGPILQKAAKEGWDIDRLQGAVYATNWYKTHAAVTRTFDSQTKLDPATQQRQIMAQADDILAQSRRAGITLDHTTLAKLAWTSLRYGWSGQQLTNAILAQGKMDLSGKTAGGALTTVDALKEQASQYLVPVSDQTLAKWTKDIAAGNLTEQDFTGYLKEQAKSLFPGLATAIDSGVTVAHYVDPYKQIAAQTLEVPPEQVNFMDPKWGKALFQTDPKTGARTSMSLADWQNTLRTDPVYGYDKTSQARSTAADLTTQLAKEFGAIG